MMKYVWGIIGLASALAYANDMPHMDPREAHEAATKTERVRYRCANGERFRVQYGFDASGAVVYAEARVNGKTRFMPLNPHRSDEEETVFGDSNNFGLSGKVVHLRHYKKAKVEFFAPGDQTIAKGCRPIVH